MGVIEYIKDTKAEMRHVTWPSRKEVILFTAVVIAVSLAVSAYLGAFDFIFSAGLREVINVVPPSKLETSVSSTTSEPFLSGDKVAPKDVSGTDGINIDVSEEENAPEDNDSAGGDLEFSPLE